MQARDRGRFVVLAGPGVIDAGALDELRAFAAAGDLGVANTWGAKGCFAWDSPHHLGTCGLQAWDFELLGFGDADAIVTVGLDPQESPEDRIALAPILALDPADLAGAVGRVRRTGEPLRNELYPRLAAVAQPGYADEKVPLHPARAVAELGAVLPEGGVVTAEAGIAGLWVARTFPTPALAAGAPRRVVVPARREPGGAVRTAREHAAAGRSAVVVAVDPVSDVAQSAIDELLDASGPAVVVRWRDDGPRLDPAEYAARLVGAIGAARPAVLEVGVCLEDTDALVAAAGPVVAWGGL
jgi:hypothetical protein